MFQLMNAAEETPRWLELPFGVRVKVRPLDAVIVAVSNSAGMAEYLRDKAEAEEAAKTGVPLDPQGLNVLNEDFVNARFSLRSAQALARHGIVDWENVVGPDRQPLPCTPEAAVRFASHPSMRIPFVNAYNATLKPEVEEGNASAPSLPGASEEAANTAGAAEGEKTSSLESPEAIPAPADASDAPSSGISPEPEPAKPA